ncbi:MAG: MnhB domain-containing protein [Nitrospirota bacterium]|nr:MnhB domain-containing protein [Nitrospirota bacterium]
MIRPHDSVIVQTLARVFVPIIQLFALYVLIHGHDSPGGGFQAGTLFGASIILLVLAFGIQNSHAVLESRAIFVGGIGILIYAGIGLLPLLLGHEYLNYAELPIPGMEASARRHWGILGIEIGVTVTVAATAVSIFYSLRGEEGRHD